MLGQGLLQKGHPAWSCSHCQTCSRATRTWLKKDIFWAEQEINGLGKMVKVMMMGWRRDKKRVVVSPLPLPLPPRLPSPSRWQSHWQPGIVNPTSQVSHFHSCTSSFVTVSGHVRDVAAKEKLLGEGEAVLPHLQTRTCSSPCWRKQPPWGTYGKDRKTSSIQTSWICRFIFGGC